MEKKQNTLLEFLPFILALIATPVLKNEWLISLAIGMCITWVFLTKFVKGEALLLTLGILFGLLVEVGGDALYKLQYWETGLLFGIPLWVPLYWGFCFVMIRRFGNLVVKK